MVNNKYRNHVYHVALGMAMVTKRYQIAILVDPGIFVPTGCSEFMILFVAHL
jgi:hypothetical protein